MSHIHFREQGKGHVVLLLHGFPLSHEIWNEIIPLLSKFYRVIAPDLPGFGKSELHLPEFSLDDIAGRINSFLDQHHIITCTVVGHSLGGYVALAMVERQPEKFSHLILFHSTPFPDAPDKKENRNKVLEFIRENGVITFTKNFIPSLFADQHHPAIPDMRKIAMASKEEALAGYTRAMRDRPDRTPMLKDFHKPAMIIAGEKDKVIPVASLENLKGYSPALKIKILNGAGHMGMIENPAESAEMIHECIG